MQNVKNVAKCIADFDKATNMYEYAIECMVRDAMEEFARLCVNIRTTSFNESDTEQRIAKLAKD